MRKLAHRPMCSALIGTVAALIAFGAAQAQAAGAGLALQRGAEFVDSRLIDVRDDRRDDRRDDKREDRKSVGEGKSVSGRVGLGGSRVLKKNTKQTNGPTP